MFNENIEELKDIIPSLAIIKLCAMIRDIYKHAEHPNILNEVDMQKLYINYGEKYTTIDKVILLIYGVTSVSSYRIEEENIPIDRFSKESLSDKEKEKIEKENIKELTSPKIIIDSNIGTVVIGYDYAYVRKEEYTPNVELTEKQKTIRDDKTILFNINYPFMRISPDTNDIFVHPVNTYEQYKKLEPFRYNNELYKINTKDYVFIRSYSKKPYEITEEMKSVELPDEKIIKIDNWTYKSSHAYTKGNKEKLITEYLNNDKRLQIVANNDYSITIISFNEQLGEYMCEKSYFVNYGME